MAITYTNTLNYRNSSIIVTSDVLYNIITVITRLIYNNGTTSEYIVNVTNSKSFTYEITTDNVYQVYQIDLDNDITTTGVYTTETIGNITSLKKNADIIYTFTIDFPINQSAITEFLAARKPEHNSTGVIAINTLAACLQRIVSNMLDNKINGMCKFDNNLIQEKDILSMGISTINYCRILGLPWEAQRIIESLRTGCTICQGENNALSCNCYA